MDKPAPAENGALEFNADARSSSYVFRAGSSLPEDKTYYFRANLNIVAFKGELFGIEPAALEPHFGKGDFTGSEVNDLRDRLSVGLAKTVAAVPELLMSVGCYNIVSYNAKFYSVPQQIPAVLSRAIRKQQRRNCWDPNILKRPYLIKLLRRERACLSGHRVAILSRGSCGAAYSLGRSRSRSVAGNHRGDGPESIDGGNKEHSGHQFSVRRESCER